MHAQQSHILCFGPVELPPLTQIPRYWNELVPENLVLHEELEKLLVAWPDTGVRED